MWYSIKRDITNFNTLLYVNNTNGIQPIKVTVYKYDTTSLNNYRVFNTETEVINTATIELTPNAVFKIYSENTVTNSVSTQIIVNYETLLKDLIETSIKELCSSDKCCQDKKQKVNTLEESLLKHLGYFFINSQHFSKFLYPVGLCLNKENIHDVLCLIFSKKYLGRGDTTKIIKKAITYFYLSFYLSETVIGNKEDVDLFFKIAEIEDYLDVNMNCIEEKVKYFLLEQNIPYEFENQESLNEEAINQLQNKVISLQNDYSLLQTNMQNLRNIIINYQPKLIGSFELDYIVASTSGLPAGTNVRLSEKAFWKGSIYIYMPKSGSIGEWSKLIPNASESLVYIFKNEYYLYNSTIQKLIKISECSGTGVTPVDNTLPDWQDTDTKGWSTSSTNFVESSTGIYGFTKQIDINPYSQTYNQSRWIPNGERQNSSSISNIVYYGNSGTSFENFRDMSIEGLFNITTPGRNILNVTGTANNNFTVGMDGQIHYLFVPRDKVELVKAEFGSSLVTTLWDSSTNSGAYKTSNPGGVWQGIYYKVYFFYAPDGAVLTDIRLTLKNK